MEQLSSGSQENIGQSKERDIGFHDLWVSTIRTPVDPEHSKKWQDKIIASQVRGVNALFFSEVPVNRTNGESRVYGAMVRRGEVGKEQVKDFITGISKGDGLDKQIEREKWSDVRSRLNLTGDRIPLQKHIYRFVTGAEPSEGKAELSDDHIKEFYTTCPTSVEYAYKCEKIINIISKNNGSNKMNEYIDDADKFGKRAYGKQWDYLRQVVGLAVGAESERKRVDNLVSSLNAAVKEVFGTPAHGYPSESFFPGGSISKKMTELGISNISSTRFDISHVLPGATVMSMLAAGCYTDIERGAFSGVKLIDAANYPGRQYAAAQLNMTLALQLAQEMGARLEIPEGTTKRPAESVEEYMKIGMSIPLIDAETWDGISVPVSS